MQQQIFQSQHQVPHVQYVQNQTVYPSSRNLQPKSGYFNDSIRSKLVQGRFPPSTSQLGDQQFAALFNQFTNQESSFKHIGTNMYNDESIYTEPTLLEHDIIHASENRPNGMVSNLISVPPLPPPPPPPIFAASVIEATTTASSVTNEANSVFPFTNGANSMELLRGVPNGAPGKSMELNYCDIVTAHSSDPEQQPQGNSSQLTITGQDLEITLNNGEITQTVLSNSTNCANYNAQLSPHLLYYYSAQRIEFLPLCDLLFNIISLAAYFCDVVFDSVTAYTLYLNDQILWLVVALALILTSATLSQFLSYTWHVRERKLNQQLIRIQADSHRTENTQEHYSNNNPYFTSPYELRSSFTLAITHILFGGVLFRYFKLFAPVNLTSVKREVRDLCVLRMVHGFCEAGPMLLLQVYLIWRKPFDSITDLNIISIFLSLFSLCWALSSFSKNIRQRQIHKLVLTWLGVIIQFFWRIGTITSRIVALTIYATIYQQWIFVVLFLHWFSMFLWLLTPNIKHTNNTIENSSSNEKKPSQKERIFQSSLIAWVYMFCFINMEDSSPRHKMSAFYCTMFLENILLMSISIFFDNQPVMPWYHSLVLYLVLGSFFFGMFFMWLYYQFFHIRHLKYSLESVDIETNFNSNDRSNYSACQNDPNQNLAENELCNYAKNASQTETHKLSNTNESSMSRLVNALSNQFFPHCYNSSNETSKSSTSNRYRTHFNNENIPGVFNCRLNPALKRKKKKPSTIPPPPQSESVIMQNNEVFSGVNSVHKRSQLETISEGVANLASVSNQLRNFNFSEVPNSRATQYRRNVLHQIQRPSTNTSILTRQLRQPSADTFWRKSALSARSLSISPSAMLKSESTFRLPAKHPFSSTITTPTSPVNFLPTENFTDKLELCLEQNKLNYNMEAKTEKEIIRPKPIVQNSIDLDSLDALNQFNLIDNVYDSNKNSAQASKQNGLFHYYYHPYSHELKLRSQTPEVLLIPHSDSGRVFYDYPSTVISMKPNLQNVDNGKNWNDDFYKQVVGHSNDSKNVDDDDIFTRQCQRPPVPGREGDEKSEENDNDNCSYIEGKRSLLNYGINRARLEQILEKKKEERNEIENHKSHFSHTLSTDLKSNSKNKHARYLTGPKKKKKYSTKYKIKTNKRSSLRTLSQHSFRSSGSSLTRSSHSSSLSSSGDDGDIESDINQHERIVITRPSTLRMTRPEENSKSQNVYDQVQNEEYDEAFSSSNGIEAHNGNSCLLSPIDSVEQEKNGVNTSFNGREPPTGSDPLPRIIRGPAHQFIASQDRSTFNGQKISNYHLGSEVRDCSNLRAKRSNLLQPMQRPKPLYHSAKYKRHNTPL